MCLPFGMGSLNIRIRTKRSDGTPNPYFICCYPPYVPTGRKTKVNSYHFSAVAGVCQCKLLSPAIDPSGPPDLIQNGAYFPWDSFTTHRLLPSLTCSA